MHFDLHSIICHIVNLFFAISLAALVFDGIHSPAWLLYIWTVTIAGTLLTPRYALLMTLGVVAFFFLGTEAPHAFLL
jgi:hypothetical protein